VPDTLVVAERRELAVLEEPRRPGPDRACDRPLLHLRDQRRLVDARAFALVEEHVAADDDRVDVLLFS